MNGSSTAKILPALVTTQSTMFDRWIERSCLPRWVVITGIGAVLVLIPVMFAYIDGVGPAYFYASYRAQIIYALLVVYILAIGRPLERTRTDVALALRPLIQVDDDAYVSVVNRSCRIRPRSEFIAFGLGMLLGLTINTVFEPLEEGPYLLTRYAYLSRIGMFGFMIWSLFSIMAITRMTNAVLHQPSRVDIFNLQPFVPVGRQSVWLSLSVVGAVTLSLLSASFSNESLWLQYAITYSILLVVIVVLFLLNTHTVHRILASAKNGRLDSIEHHLARAYYRFEELLSTSGDTHVVATEINALATVKQEVKRTRTWPYNTEMLRTLVISVLTPIAVGLSRLIPILLAGDLF